jgi:hypothetical protein
MGQLCRACYDGDNNHNHVVVPENLIYNTPNDFDLGGKIRQIYYENLKGLK